jgi:hypothetical protein
MQKDDSIANVRSVFAPDLGADEAVGISTNHLVRIDRRLGVVLQGVGFRERRRCHESGEGGSGQHNLKGRLHDQPLSQSDFPYLAPIPHGTSAIFDRVGVEKIACL